MSEQNSNCPTMRGGILPRPSVTSWPAVLILLIGLCTFSSCDQRVELFSQSMEMDNVWGVSDEVSFEVAISDTSQNYDIQLLFDNTDDYPFRNMYVFVDMQFPNQKWLHDTVEFYLTDQTGRWLGKSIGDGYHNQVLYKFNRKLPLPGDYLVQMRHGMRTDELQGIEQVGLRIIESK